MSANAQTQEVMMLKPLHDYVVLEKVKEEVKTLLVVFV